MARPSPLRRLQEQAEAEFIHFGPGAADASDVGVDLVATYGEVEAEYAAIRKSAALMELPHRGTLRITGGDRRDFLNRMLTADLNELTQGRAARSFWLNRKGRIQADLVLVELGDAMLVDVDLAVASKAIETLDEFIFTEDVAIADATDEFHRLALHGPGAVALLRSVCDDETGRPLADLNPWRVARVRIADRDVVVLRRDTTGEVGLELTAPAEGVVDVHERILETGLRDGLRSIGWLAYNIARLEAGRPLFLVDFGPDSLPHETGILREVVSFTKGCYLGQEVVARMESLGHPSKRLVGLKIEGEAMPVTGSQVFLPGGAPGEVVGAVTSATLSPMLGATVIALAMVKWAHTNDGTELNVMAEGRPRRARVHPLKFWSRA